MLHQIEKKLFSSGPFQRTVEHLQNRRRVTIAGLAGSALGFVVKFLFENGFPFLAVLSPDSDKAEKIWNDLVHLLDADQVYLFLARREEHTYTHRLRSAVIGQQLKSLDRLMMARPGILVTSILACQDPLPAPHRLRRNRLVLAPGQEIGLEKVVDKLGSFEYERVDLVSGVGEFCIRGGLIDVFPYESMHPIRIEFFGDVVDTIRSFDVISQRSQKEMKQISILSPSLKNLENDRNEEHNLFSLLHPDTLLVLDQPELYERSLQTPTEWWPPDFEFHPHSEGQSFPSRRVFQGMIQRFCHLEIRQLGRLKQTDVHFRMRANENFRGNIRLLRTKIKKFLDTYSAGYSDTFILLEEKYEVDRLADLFDDGNLPIRIGQGVLDSGFAFHEAGLLVVTEKDLYGRIPRRKALGKYRGGIPISKLNALKYGELMVHVDYGIGRYLGLTKITVAGAEQECLKLQYRDGDLLYVNIDHMNKVSRFKGGEGVVPNLSRLGGKDWERLKEKTKKAIEKMAKDLLELYAVRKAKKGYAFSKDQTWQKELEASFLYDETPDQIRSIEEVKRDMESESIMDRLVCGDVGFGKTEVALRAAFKAVQDGKQVAVLVPTTILAQQHYETFTERLANYPVVVELFSRFRSRGQQLRIVAGLRTGSIDIVIGTHRLLSKDVQFKDLGLLIVDEEHRFGVRQKEKIKTLFQLVDVLSLTATPIPRTLHLALMGSRDMSTIQTPPKGRIPVIAEVVPFDKNLIRQAILNEVHRGGQVFVVHNRVRSIDSMARMIQKLIPDLRIGVAHGQMHPHDLERAMLDFVHKKYDCLVCTMIIESGLDIPNVNTLIVNRADKFGLAQLYQLKGRVGRSNRQAYAYFLAPAFKFLSENALKRLQTIEEHLELGSGLQIAMKDLEIRGAGNLLGKQQSGYINAVGFDLYCKLLDETVAKIRGEQPIARDTGPAIDVLVESEFDAYIPEDYVEMDYERINIYQRLTTISSEESLQELEEELRDRFGMLPKATRVLLEISRLKLLAARLGIEKLRIRKGELTAYFSSTYYNSSNRDTLQKLIQSLQEASPVPPRFLHGKKFGFKYRLKSADESSLHFTRKFFTHLIRKAA